jgi:undecaprenyl diphosphate synthase
MDGNGRWAAQRNLPRPVGHRAGVESVRTIVEECVKQGIAVLTLFAFSSENWQRPKTEVGLIMELFMTALQQEAKRLHRNGVQLRVIGDRNAFSEQLQALIRKVEQLTADNTSLVLQIAANYGGRWDITQAVRSIAHRVSAGKLDPREISAQSVATALSFSDLPDPDLFIRTGGEQRLSNFLLWQAAYSELYFTDLLWPDFGAQDLAQALREFSERERRFGRTGEQVREADR